MVLDARQANEYHRAPPHTSLASVKAPTALDFGGDYRPEHITPDLEFFSGSVDLRDGFYQFMNKGLASWFTINLPGLTAAEMGVTTVYSTTSSRDMSELLIPTSSCGQPFRACPWAGRGCCGRVMKHSWRWPLGPWTRSPSTDIAQPRCTAAEQSTPPTSTTPRS